ncbi:MULTISPECIES: heavy metal translocating P-type ATPase [unclassified Haematospirillum]|uniref:heavy metal translocating P-type ATPase n=1 Tax=unclassified Haematospirillum TaxID=2622088 RepID=UPI001FD77687|nr:MULTISPECIES: heavy metal translocating P-type ATPase [unclassified Haematospirillum]
MSPISSSRADLKIMRLRVGGMDCPGCAGELERTLTRIPYVEDVKVSFSNSSVTIACWEGKGPSLSDIEAEIRNLGMFVTPQEPGTEPTSYSWKNNRNVHLVAITSALVGTAALVGTIVPELADRAWTIAAALSLLPFVRQAFSLAGAGNPFSVQMLMTVAATGALVIGAASEAATVVFLFSIGELLEGLAADRARRSIRDLVALIPQTAIVEEDGSHKIIQAHSLVPGQIVLVRTGDRVPADGIMSDEGSLFDQSPITGESIPVIRKHNADVYAGSINVGNPVRIRVEKTAQDTTIARIVQLVEEARSTKAPFARLIDRFSARYTPAAMLLAGIVITIPPLAFGESWETWIYRGLSLLLIACPCALVLSTPAAVAAGISTAARQGLLLKGGAVLEAIGKTRTVAFDKTGTLTSGTPQITDVVPVQESKESILRLAASLETGSSHPLASAIIKQAKEENLTIPQSRNISVFPGHGVQGNIEGRCLTIGSAHMPLEEKRIPSSIMDQVAALEDQGKTVAILYGEQSVLGLIAARDELRPDAASAIKSLKDAGIHVVMLTGDSHKTASVIAKELEIEAKANLLPEDKLKTIRELERIGPVTMVGDGINDAPALAVASVGVAMGSGTDVALETADAALLGNRVGGIVDLVTLSKATIRNIWQNIALALGLKTLFLAGAVTGTTTLWMAVFADTGATILVTLNALRLLGFQPIRNGSQGAGENQPHSHHHHKQNQVASV